jgi:hypothetical protein
MGQGDVARDARQGRVAARQDVGADPRVAPHDRQLARGQPPGLAQDGVRDPHLADVVEDGGASDQLRFRRREPDRGGQPGGEPPHPAVVLADTVVPQLGDQRELLQHLQARRLELAGAPLHPAFEQPVEARQPAHVVTEREDAFDILR